MGEGAWEELIAQAYSRRPTPLRAHSYLRAWGSASRPVLLMCEDGNEYVVKGRHSGRMVVNEAIVAGLGSALAAPIPSIALVEVPQELINLQSELGHMTAGIALGTRFIPHCSDRAGLDHASVPENAERFAALAVLYGWTVANDHQFIYENAAPHLVHSVDHGHFFPQGPDWTEQSLTAAPQPVPDSTITTAAGLTSPQLREPGCRLREIPDEYIAATVAWPPNEWGISPTERVAMAEFLARRRDHLADQLCPPAQEEEDG